MQADHIAEKNVKTNKYKIRKEISRVKLEYEAYHERNIEYLDQEDDDYKSPWQEDAVDLKAVTDSSDSGEITFKKPAYHNIFLALEIVHNVLLLLLKMFRMLWMHVDM